MTIAYIASATASTEDATLTINKPAGSGAAGDFLIAILGYYDQAGPVTAPDGWTLLDSGQHSGQTYNMAAVYYRVCNGSEGSSFDWSFGGSLDQQHGGIMAFSGVNTSNPIQTHSEKLDGSSDFLTAASITVTTAPCMLVFLGGCNASGFNTGKTTSPPADYTEAIEVHGSSYGGVYGAYKAQATTGATGSVFATNSSATAFVTYLVALNEATAGTVRNLFVSAAGASAVSAPVASIARKFVTAAVMATNTANADLSTGGEGGDNPITFSTPTTVSRGTAGTTLTVNAPANIADDVIYLAWVSDGDGDTATPPDGFTAVTNYNGLDIGVGPSGKFYLWSKPSAGSEPSTYTVNSTVSERSAMIAFAVRNQLNVHAYGTTQSNTSGSSTTATAPAVTTTVTGAMRVSLIVSNQGVGPVSTLAGHTELGSVNQPSGGMISVQYKELPDATTDSSATSTFSAGGAWLGISFAIAPTTSGSGATVSFAAIVQAATTTNGAAVNVSRPLLANPGAVSATVNGTLYVTRKLLGDLAGATETAEAVAGIDRPLTAGAGAESASAEPVLAVVRYLALDAPSSTDTPTEAALDMVRALAAVSAGTTDTPDVVALGFIRSLLFNRAMITGTSTPDVSIMRALVGAVSATASTSDPALHMTIGLLANTQADASTGSADVDVFRRLAATGGAVSATGTPTLSIAGIVSFLLSASASSSTPTAELDVARTLVTAIAGASATSSPALSVAALIELLASIAAQTIAPTPGLAVARPMASSVAGTSATGTAGVDIARTLAAAPQAVSEAPSSILAVTRALTAQGSASSVTAEVPLSIAALISLLASIAAQSGTPDAGLAVARRLAVGGAGASLTGDNTALAVLRALYASPGAATLTPSAVVAVARALQANAGASSNTSTISALSMYLIAGLLQLAVAAKRPSVGASAKRPSVSATGRA